jgi:hypothetical protein
MKRKFHHTLMALSATATVFTVLLFAGTPVQPPSRAMVGPDRLPSLVADTSVVAASAVELVRDGAGERRHLRHSRALLALPYFSFAQGLRRNRS